MVYIDFKYINQLAPFLRNFRKKSNNLYNFSCPLCGDSGKNRRKARAFLYEKKGGFFFYCHNCVSGMSLQSFIKTVTPEVYGDYVFERFRENKTTAPEQNFSSKVNFIDFGIFKGLKKISELGTAHSARKYLEGRKIAEEQFSRFFYCENFMKFVNGVVYGKFSDEALLHDEPRIIIPFLDKERKVVAFQGRSLMAKSPNKYITIVLGGEQPVFGRDVLDVSKKIFVLEGPFDSLFICNSIAVASSNLPVAATLFPKENLVLIFDNEPRNKNIVKIMSKSIDSNFNIVIWPNSFVFKDINEAIIGGVPQEDIMKIIKNNIYSGLKAKLVLNSYNKN